MTPVMSSILTILGKTEVPEGDMRQLLNGVRIKKRLYSEKEKDLNAFVELHKFKKEESEKVYWKIT